MGRFEEVRVARVPRTFILEVDASPESIHSLRNCRSGWAAGLSLSPTCLKLDALFSCRIEYTAYMKCRAGRWLLSSSRINCTNLYLV
jgi:hypothetical protein